MSVAISAAAMASSSAAIASANKAKRTAECNVFMQGFDSAKATTSEKQSYASCVQHIYPVYKEPSAGQEIAIKFAIAVLIVLFFCGAVKGWKTDKWIGSFCMGIVFPLGAVIICAICGLIAAGVVRIFS